MAELRRLPLITKHDIRRDFPRNFLRAGVELDTLLDQDLVELEQTSGTSEERTPLLLGRGWWAEQETRALRLNPYVTGVLDEFSLFTFVSNRTILIRPQVANTLDAHEPDQRPCRAADSRD